VSRISALARRILVRDVKGKETVPGISELQFRQWVEGGGTLIPDDAQSLK